MSEHEERRGPVGLQEHELEALVVIIRLATGLDREFSDEEADVISSIALEAGEEAFWTHMQASQQKEHTLQSILDLAKSVVRQEARNAIYICVADLTNAHGASSEEQGLLRRLQQLWNIQP